MEKNSINTSIEFLPSYNTPPPFHPIGIVHRAVFFTTEFVVTPGNTIVQWQ